MNTSKNDEILEESSESLSKDSYCKNLVPSLIQSTTEYYMRKKIHQDLEIERLTRENAEIDKIIEAKLEEIKKSKKTSAEWDLKLYNETQINDQSKARFENTGEILTVLTNETKEIQSLAKTLEARRREITTKVQGFVEQKKRNDEMKKKINVLEKQIKELLDEPEPTLDENLPKRNEKLKILLQEKKNTLELNRIKKVRIVELKERKMDLFMKINEKQETNRIKSEKVEIRKANIIKSQEETDRKKQDIKEKINNAESKKDQLLQILKDSKNRCDEKHLKMEEQKARITQKENELKLLKEKCEAKQECINKGQEKKQQEYEIERGKLVELEEKIEAVMTQNAQNINILNEKTQEFINLKCEKEQLTEHIYEKKIKAVTEQFENRKQQNNYIEEKLRSEKMEVKKLKIRLEALETTQKDAERKLEEYPQNLEQKREKLQLQHKETIETLLKRQKVCMALIDVEQHCMDRVLKEVDDVRKEIQALKDKNTWDEMAITRRQANLKAINERVKREEQEYEKLLEQVKQREPKSFKIIEIQETDVNKGSGPASQKEFPGILKGQAVAKEGPEGMEGVETIENEETLSFSGRKSPSSILKKSPIRPKRAQTPTKRVTFEGVPSESSSQSLSTNNEENKSASHFTFDELLADLKTVVRKPKKPSMDF